MCLISVYMLLFAPSSLSLLLYSSFLSLLLDSSFLSLLLSPRLYLLYFLFPCTPRPLSLLIFIRLLSLALPLLFSPPGPWSPFAPPLSLLLIALVCFALFRPCPRFSPLLSLVLSLLLLLLLLFPFVCLFSPSVSIPPLLFFSFCYLCRCPLYSAPFYLFLLSLFCFALFPPCPLLSSSVYFSLFSILSFLS